ncbi:DUF4142 domain-containing protein [Chitinophagaceae bacterium LB-8]|jgi:putative membrane protein|uniref:DUF4142 domain-containing protein n=1 Tax=Paraflavisolibacter caeni TaxID=2982496 RepID=A0A9X2Y059_9BACT|nr:DUF4142 domain-containing protein [Paraflavisolibacter caeni]MCU7552166.1 DUF4142 domain-containing protein [Paraflavisolibacter caeni]
MKKYVFPLMLLGTTVVMSCGNGGNKESETDTTTTVTTTDTSTLADNTVTTGTTYSSTPLIGADTTFVKEAASGSLMEIESGKLAQQIAINPRVKSLGEMMVRDHSKLYDELKSLASAKNLMLSDSLSKKSKDHLEAMRKMTGKDFDKHYPEMMVKDHTEDVRKFEKASNSANDSDLKGWVDKTLPVLKVHLDSAKAINQSKM